MTLVSALIIMRLGEFRRPVCESPFRRRPAFFGPTYTKVYELDAGTRTRRRPSRSLENHAAGVLLAFVRHLNKYPPLNTPGPPQTWASARREDRQTVLTSRPARRPSVLSSVTPSSTRSVSSLSLSLSLSPRRVRRVPVLAITVKRGAGRGSSSSRSCGASKIVPNWARSLGWSTAAKKGALV